MSELNQKLEQKLLQKLSPQQIQLIKLLEVPIIELEQRIKKEIEENPALEETADSEEDYKSDENTFDENSEDDEIDTEPEKVDSEEEFEDTELEKDNYEESDNEFSIEDYIEEDEIPSYKLQDNNYAEDSDRNQTYYSSTSSLNEYLEDQLSMLELDELQNYVAGYIIGSIDESGYLRRDVKSIPSDLLVFHNIEVSQEQVDEVLQIIQDEFDPPGIGARNIQECLLLQIKRKIAENESDEVLNAAYTVIADYFEIFSKKHYDKIKSKLEIDDTILRKVIELILKLNPKPGNTYSAQSKKNFFQILPDFILQNYDGDLILTLNSLNIPSLRVNKEFESILKTYSEGIDKKRKDKDTVSFVKQKLDSAKWFIEAIKQRQNTLLKTMESILEYQKDFFLSGDDTKLKPMILKDIAEKTALDISTISRVANSKYIQTPFGIYPLKFFFSEGMENEQGEEVSTRRIKKILKEAIDNEDKKRPLTDEKLSKLLHDNGYKIARRTVAKYREQMGILVARLRKKI